MKTQVSRTNRTVCIFAQHCVRYTQHQLRRQTSILLYRVTSLIGAVGHVGQRGVNVIGSPDLLQRR